MMRVASQNSPVERLDQGSKDEALRTGKVLESGARGGDRSVGMANLAPTNGAGADRDGATAATDDRAPSSPKGHESSAIAPKDCSTSKSEENGSSGSPFGRPVPVISPHSAALFLKNEMHRLLVVMRTQQQQQSVRYVSPSRFTAEFVDSVHPLAQKLEESHQSLGHDHLSESDVAGFVDVLCELVEERDGSLAVTGAALEAIQKLFTYGMIQEEEVVAQVAKCLVLGNFEDPSEEASTLPTATGSAPSSSAPAAATLARRASSSVAQHEPFAKDARERLRFRLLGMCSLVTTRLLLPARATTTTTTSDQATLLATALMDNCWRVVSKSGIAASPLLYAEAVEALSEVTACVFGPGRVPSKTVEAVRLVLLQRISRHVGSASADIGGGGGGASSSTSEARSARQQQTQSSLQLLNLALELSSGELSAAEMAVLQEDTCRQLLLASSVRDVDVLAGTLRAISNLLPLRAHLKVQLEVLLVGVHLRVLAKGSGSSNEEIEVVLETIQSCCQDSHLLTDIYFNYDCDLACTDLFESIVSAVGRAALPDDWSSSGDETAIRSKLIPTAPQERQVPTPSSSGAGAGKNGKQKYSNAGRPSLKSHLEASHPKTTADPVSAGDATAKASTAPFNHLNRLAIESLFAVLDSISQRNGATSTQLSTERTSTGCAQNEERLLQAKQKKDALRKVAIAFNLDPTGSAWTDVAVAEGRLDSDTSARGVADLLYSAPGLNKAMVGEYLSKGPASDYPFHADVRNHFASLFDFSDLTFAAALRMFLSKFRLPGEAQCIDRLMEAFSGQLYKQQLGKTFFKNSDAVYVLSFSTIMLNTDLHNPTIKEESRMTRRQFIRNNRGINGGEDMPEDFLSELYDQIKEKQIQVKREMTDVITRRESESDFRTAWEYVVEKKQEVSCATFTETSTSTAQTVLHDKIMFSALAKWLVQALPSTFLRSWDDALVVRALNGMKNAARLAAHFELNWVIDDILSCLLPMGRDYISGCVALDYSAVNDCGSVVSSVSRTVASTEGGAEDDETTTCESELPIPYGLLSSRDERLHRAEIFGSASHRGILALDCSFVLLQQHTTRVSKSWSGFVECLCGLRDARALPAGLADLDDFADSDGSVLPMSRFARISQRRLDEYYRSKSDPDASKQKGWFRSFFKKQSTGKESDSFDEDEYVALDRGELSPYSKALLGIAEAAGIDSIILTSTTEPATAELSIRAFLDVVGRYPYDDDPVLEQRAVFALELATRALLSNKQQASDSFALFLNQFESILGQVRETLMPAPFVLERLVVTVLRACIHLYEHQELRPHLRASLHLLTMALPKSFIYHIADRMACGLAIILRASFQYFETPNEWAFMGDTLDMLAQHDKARVFVFDGIASTVEYSLSSADETSDLDGAVTLNGGLPELSLEACSALSKVLFRFILGFYKNDFSLNVPAMLCLEKLYRHKVEVILRDEAILSEGLHSSVEAIDPRHAAPDKDLWQNLAVAMYSCCRSTDPEVSQHGCECFQRVILQTSVEQIPDDKWIAVLYLVVNKQPPMVAVESRVNCFSLLGQLLTRLIPELSNHPENRDDLCDLVSSVASLAAENMMYGSKGVAPPLFDMTLQTITYLSNHMLTPEWRGEADFSSWASETLLSELEKLGDEGASTALKARNALVRATEREGRAIETDA